MERQKPILKAYGLGVNMNLYEQIIDVYSELIDKDLNRMGIVLRNDSDGLGDYIEKWDYEQPIPDGLKLGK
jgi:hypothetical protein